VVKRMITFIVLGISFNAAAAVPDAYRQYAAKHQVPAELLFAVCLQESGRSYQQRLLPWPWTLNVAGKGQFFQNQMDAQYALDDVIASGSCRVDIGICQVHWCSHRHNFDSPSALLDPYVNIDYAARLLREEFHRTSGGAPYERWWEAVGRYHSPGTPSLADRYRRRVKARWQSLMESTQ
jgi:hypothetical protein